MSVEHYPASVTPQPSGEIGADEGRADDQLIDNLRLVARAVAQTFAPFCEVVVHDLRDPDSSLVAIENPLSRRAVGDPPTELGLARIADPTYPDLVANYPNRFSDGRRVKSTSIGFRNQDGTYIAVLGMNIDLSLFEGLGAMLEQFGRMDQANGSGENLDPANSATLRTRVAAFAAARATTPRALTTEQRRELVRDLRDAGYLEVRRAVETVAEAVGVSRATIYSDAR